MVVGAFGVGGALAVAPPAQAATVVGVMYQHSNYGGAQLTHTVTPNGFTCTASLSNVDVQYASMPSGWNDVVSSHRGYANCWARLYEHSNYGGALLDYAGSRSSLGAMNDKTSSVRYS
jgi:hypothetical protein